MNNIFAQLAIVLSLSSILGFIVHKFKLPLVIAYLLAGVLISVVSLTNLQNVSIFPFLPNLGIALVLFLIGMELDLREIKILGLPIMVASFCQIVISILVGFAISGLLGFNQTISLYLGIGLAFSSTIVVIKMLLEKKDLASLYGKLSVGILLIEDLVAILVLMFLTVTSSVPMILTVALKAALLFALTFLLSKYVLEKIFDAVAHSVELLFLTAITWCFIFTTLAIWSGFSLVIGAFLAGVALASSPYHLQIQGKVKPLRDFFVALFFIYLGSQVKLAEVLTYYPVILLFTLYALVAKPLIFLLILGTFGFRKHTLFKTALNLSQISEFSLVIVLLGINQGVLPGLVLSILASVAVLSVVCSSMMVSSSRQIYQIFSPFLSFFEHSSKLHYLETKGPEGIENHVVVVGAHRLGAPVIKYLKKAEIPLVVMDFNPHLVEKLRQDGVRVIYGDMSDPDILEHLNLAQAKLIISTVTDLGANEVLLDECRRKKVRAKILVTAQDELHSKALKVLGADFVILPEQVSGAFLATQLKTHWPEINFDI